MKSLLASVLALACAAPAFAQHPPATHSPSAEVPPIASPATQDKSVPVAPAKADAPASTKGPVLNEEDFYHYRAIHAEQRAVQLEERIAQLENGALAQEQSEFFEGLAKKYPGFRPGFDAQGQFGLVRTVKPATMPAPKTPPLVYHPSAKQETPAPPAR